MTPSFALSGTTSNLLPVEVDVSPESINVKCTGKDNVRATILGSASVDVTLIDPESLMVEGVPVASCSQHKQDLTCKVPSCPLGSALAAKRGSNRTVTVEVTGSLLAQFEVSRSRAKTP